MSWYIVGEQNSETCFFDFSKVTCVVGEMLFAFR